MGEGGATPSPSHTLGRPSPQAGLPAQGRGGFTSFPFLTLFLAVLSARKALWPLCGAAAARVGPSGSYCCARVADGTVVSFSEPRSSLDQAVRHVGGRRRPYAAPKPASFAGSAIRGRLLTPYGGCGRGPPRRRGGCGTLRHGVQLCRTSSTRADPGLRYAIKLGPSSGVTQAEETVDGPTVSVPGTLSFILLETNTGPCQRELRFPLGTRNGRGHCPRLCFARAGSAAGQKISQGTSLWGEGVAVVVTGPHVYIYI